MNEVVAVPAVIPVNPVTVGADQVYVVPDGTMSVLDIPPPFAGDRVACDPEQIV